MGTVGSRDVARRTLRANGPDGCHVVAREQFRRRLRLATLAALLGRVVEAASVAGAPLFAGWRTLPEPDDAPALALHRLNALRELRGALHGAAVLTVGLSPVEAIVVHTPGMIPVFGWQEVPARSRAVQRAVGAGGGAHRPHVRPPPRGARRGRAQHAG